jgi:hypothetical protein
MSTRVVFRSLIASAYHMGSVGIGVESCRILRAADVRRPFQERGEEPYM